MNQERSALSVSSPVSSASRLPLVAIVGRPNVGKSTLFNRLAGGLMAVVEDLPGTTRDRLYADIDWLGHLLTLVDMAGLEARPEPGLPRSVREQVELAMQQADLILLLVDVTEGVTAGDWDAAERMRRSAKPLVLVANKADSPRREMAAAEFYQLGLGDPIPISAYHNLGIDNLMQRVLAHLPPPPSPDALAAETLKLAIVGRPNVGKSQLLNAILGEERVVVDETPGTTRDAVDTSFRHGDQELLLIDTAGIRRRGRIERGVEYYSVVRALQAIQRADVVLLVLDAQELVVAQDTHIAGYAVGALKGLVLVINKWDLVQGLERAAADYVQEVRDRFRFFRHASVVITSAKLGQGIAEVLAAAQQVGVARHQRVPTALLNVRVADAVAAHHPASVRGRQLKVLYVTQTDVNPPTFVFFVNHANFVQPSYQRYLENRLRETFDFSGTPLRLVFRSRQEE